jgi:hypothetical protein
MRRLPQLSPGESRPGLPVSPVNRQPLSAISNPRGAHAGTRSGGALVHQLVADGNLKRDR